MNRGGIGEADDWQLVELLRVAISTKVVGSYGVEVNYLVGHGVNYGGTEGTVGWFPVPVHLVLRHMEMPYKVQHARNKAYPLSVHLRLIII